MSGIKPTFEEKMGELMLDLPHPKNKNHVFIFVEGNTDIRLFRKLLNHKNCNVEYLPGGKVKLEEGINRLINMHPFVVAIRDADFIHLKNEDYDKPNIFLTDFHDLEMTILSEKNIVTALYSEFTSLENEQQQNHFTNLLELLKPISCLKFLNEKNKIELKFKKLGLQAYIDIETNDIKIDDLISVLLQRSPDKKISDINVLKSQLQELINKDFELLQLTNGHDFVATLGEYFNKINAGKDIAHEHLASIVRISYNLFHFQKTTLYTNLKQWAEAKNVELHA